MATPPPRHFGHSSTALLLEKGAPLRVNEDVDSVSVTALECDLMRTQLNVVQHIVEKLHVHIRSVCIDYKTAMHYLAFSDDYQAVLGTARYLRKLGVPLDERGNPRVNPLLFACCRANFSAAPAFMDASCDLHQVLALGVPWGDRLIMNDENDDDDTDAWDNPTRLCSWLSG
ncbi:hypothetical protein B0H66DRAFT_529988 [Apodospora peruviana]|uniref:Uncharacterized protein n=1 Tax=Apodospora peruviana TaxID=516989 RepID=A0AAE0IJL1_9PEZI|nr:hypothetical protein B0H66DRAFT_529988 [Apodospora peruviana]